MFKRFAAIAALSATLMPPLMLTADAAAITFRYTGTTSNASSPIPFGNPPFGTPFELVTVVRYEPYDVWTESTASRIRTDGTAWFQLRLGDQVYERNSDTLQFPDGHIVELINNNNAGAVKQRLRFTDAAASEWEYDIWTAYHTGTPPISGSLLADELHVASVDPQQWTGLLRARLGGEYVTWMALDFQTAEFTVTQVPEPATWLMFAGGAAALLCRVRRTAPRRTPALPA